MKKTSDGCEAQVPIAGQMFRCLNPEYLNPQYLNPEYINPEYLSRDAEDQ